MSPRELGRERLDRDAEPAARHAALVAKLGVDLAGHVRGDREADAGAPGDDRGVDPDHLALHVHERTAGVAGIDGGVGLQKVVERTLVELPRLGADDAGGDRGLQTERRAHREDPVADLDPVGVTKPSVLEAALAVV